MTTITVNRTLLEQALAALNTVQPQNMGPGVHQAKEALRAALAAPPQVPLTDEQIATIYVKWSDMAGVSYADLMRMVERKHGIGVEA